MNLLLEFAIVQNRSLRHFPSIGPEGARDRCRHQTTGYNEEVATLLKRCL